jgi:hypothetical protein
MLEGRSRATEVGLVEGFVGNDGVASWDFSLRPGERTECPSL